MKLNTNQEPRTLKGEPRRRGCGAASSSRLPSESTAALRVTVV
jgi:hypothetical protein